MGRNSLYPHPSSLSALARAAFIRDPSGVGHLSCCPPSPQDLWQLSTRSFYLEVMTFPVGKSPGRGVSFVSCTKSIWGGLGTVPSPLGNSDVGHFAPLGDSPD